MAEGVANRGTNNQGGASPLVFLSKMFAVQPTLVYG